jgi:hypothetical protein
MRRIARSLALAWAATASLVVVLAALYALSHGGFAAMIGLRQSDDMLRLLVSVGFWLTLALLILVPWISALVAWEWEVMGGLLLMVLGAVSVPLCVGMLPLAAGILFLATWWILESSRVAQRRRRQHELERTRR